MNTMEDHQKESDIQQSTIAVGELNDDLKESTIATAENPSSTAAVLAESSYKLEEGGYLFPLSNDEQPLLAESHHKSHMDFAADDAEGNLKSNRAHRSTPTAEPSAANILERQLPPRNVLVQPIPQPPTSMMNNKLGPDPINTVCPRCNTNIITTTEESYSLTAWVVCVLCFFLGPCCCFCIPFCSNADCFRDTRHFCPIPDCRHKIGIHFG